MAPKNPKPIKVKPITSAVVGALVLAGHKVAVVTKAPKKGK
jgi:hypothetical protein